MPKGSRRLGGLDDMIISLYAGGMTIRDIQHHLISRVPVTRSPHGDHTTVHWGEGLRPLTTTPAEGFGPQEWFRAASADTGTSHIKVGRPYVVASEHSEDIFIASSHAEAMSMFRDFEARVNGGDHR